MPTFPLTQDMIDAHADSVLVALKVENASLRQMNISLLAVAVSLHSLTNKLLLKLASMPDGMSDLVNEYEALSKSLEKTRL